MHTAQPRKEHLWARAYLGRAGRSSSSTWCRPGWCTVPAPSPGRTAARHTWTWRGCKGWRKRLRGATVGAEGRGKVSFIFNIGLFFSSSKWKSVTKKTRIQPRLLMFGTKRKTNLSNHPPQCLQQKSTGSILNIRAARQPESLETVVKNLSLHFHNNHYVFWWHTMIWTINTVVPVTAL